MAPKINDEKRLQCRTQTLWQPVTKQACHHHQLLSLFVVKNMAAVKHFHPFLLLASLFILHQVFPPLLASSYTVLFQVFLGHLCLLTPWGSGAVLTSQYLHSVPLIRGITTAISSLISHRSSSGITSGHLMLKIHHRELLIKTCSCLITGSVTFHSSQPYSKTNFTMLL
jgi:hypothetical protein